MFQVVQGVDEVVFTGSEAEAGFWIEAKGAEPHFTGTAAEVDAWVAERQAEEDDFFWPNLLMVSGAVLLMATLAMGRDREDLSIPGYEYHFIDEAEDPPTLHRQIPEGFAGEASAVDPSRADASAWLEALPVVKAFREQVLV